MPHRECLLNEQLLHRLYSDIPNVPVGQPGSQDQLVEKGYQYDNAKSREILGLEYTSLEAALVMTVDSLRSRFGI